jgi:putative ABC transport system substrate-binding protein
VIGTEGTACTRALQQATRTIPIFTGVGDPVGAGFAKSLARPGGNITGLSSGTREIAQKQIELLRVVVPKLSTLAIVGAHKSLAYLREITEPVTSAARGAGVSAELRQISSLQDIEGALRALPSAGRGAVVFMGNLGNLDERSVMQVAIRLRVPAMVGGRESVEKGGLLTYTLVHENEARRTLELVDKLLRGADPAEIPFELPTKSSFVFNRRTAEAIGVKFPADFLLRADEVIG